MPEGYLSIIMRLLSKSHVNTNSIEAKHRQTTTKHTQSTHLPGTQNERTVLKKIQPEHSLLHAEAV